MDGERTEFGGRTRRARWSGAAILALGAVLLVAGASRAATFSRLSALDAAIAALAVVAGVVAGSAGALQLWAWRRPARLAFDGHGILLERAGRSYPFSWGAFRRVAVEPAGRGRGAVCVKVWPTPGTAMPPRAAGRLQDGAFSLFQMNLLEATPDEVTAAIRRFAPPGTAG